MTISLSISLLRKGMRFLIPSNVTGEHWETMEGVSWLQQQYWFHHPCKKRELLVNANSKVLSFFFFIFHCFVYSSIFSFLQEDAKKLDRNAKDAYTAWKTQQPFISWHRFEYISVTVLQWQISYLFHQNMTWHCLCSWVLTVYKSSF